MKNKKYFLAIFRFITIFLGREWKKGLQCGEGKMRLGGVDTRREQQIRRGMFSISRSTVESIEKLVKNLRNVGRKGRKNGKIDIHEDTRMQGFLGREMGLHYSLQTYFFRI